MIQALRGEIIALQDALVSTIKVVGERFHDSKGFRYLIAQKLHERVYFHEKVLKSHGDVDDRLHEPEEQEGYVAKLEELKKSLTEDWDERAHPIWPW